MSRNWLLAALFALALAVQAMAPMAGRAAAAQPGGFGDASETCLTASGGGGDGRQTPGHDHSHHRASCALCQAFCDGVAPVASRPVSLGMAPVRWTTVPWTAADRALPRPPRDFARQARAPPVRS